MGMNRRRKKRGKGNRPQSRELGTVLPQKVTGTFLAFRAGYGCEYETDQGWWLGALFFGAGVDVVDSGFGCEFDGKLGLGAGPKTGWQHLLGL